MDVFVYGTLTDPERTDAVLDEFEYRGVARLVGLHRVAGEYPTLAPGGRTPGRLLRTPQRAALDRYEGVGRGLYVRVTVPLTGPGPDEVTLYVGDPDALNAPTDWPGDGPFPERVSAYLDDNDVSVERI